MMVVSPDGGAFAWSLVTLQGPRLTCARMNFRPDSLTVYPPYAELVDFTLQSGALKIYVVRDLRVADCANIFFERGPPLYPPLATIQPEAHPWAIRVETTTRRRTLGSRSTFSSSYRIAQNHLRKD